MQKVSVIIPNYNYGRYLRQAVESALNQTLRPHEIIVVDDGSTDESRDILREFGDSVIVIEQSNKGVAAARNNASAIATGNFLAFIDADDFWHASKLEKQMQVFQSDAEIGFVHCGSTYVDENGAILKEYVTGEQGWVADSLLKFHEVVIANTIVVERKLFAKIGGYDTTRELHPSEDWDLCYRLARESKLGFVREPLLFYRQHGRGGHENIAKMERAMLIAFNKAFCDPLNDIQQLRREAYGNLYFVLAGSYYHSGRIGKALVNAMKSVFHYPPIAASFFSFATRFVKGNS
jgi:glycosyltransferase involved in cell wall biosynthesis